MEISILLLLLLSELVHFANSVKVPANIVLILTDDQDIFMNGMDPLLKTKKLLKERGTTFSNAFTTSPICCPSRASLLTGLYPHNHRVHNNSLAGGCSSRGWQKLHEPNTFAVRLKKLGFSTFYAGKYLNQYGHLEAGGAHHIPPGWDRWIGLIGNSKYYNYSLSIDGKKKYYTNHYLTKLIESHAVNFIKNQTTSKPFLMMIALPAPHEPFTPEPKYRGYFNGTKVPRTVQFNFSNNSKKHWLARLNPLPLPESFLPKLDAIQARRWATLLSVDDLVESVVKTLKRMKLLKNTYLIFTSDNGYHLGQFSFTWDKRQMYDFDIRVPFIVRGPGMRRNVSTENPVLLLDIAPTILHIGGGDMDPSMDGQSFLPLQRGRSEDRGFLVEYHGESGAVGSDPNCWSSDEGTSHCSSEALCKCQDSRNNTYSCLRNISRRDNFMYCNFQDVEGHKEAYDLKKDPYEIENIYSQLSLDCRSKIERKLRYLMTCRGSKCYHKKLTRVPTNCKEC